MEDYLEGAPVGEMNGRSFESGLEIAEPALEHLERFFRRGIERAVHDPNPEMLARQRRRCLRRFVMGLDDREPSVDIR